jgi:hypothetical protein
MKTEGEEHERNWPPRAILAALLICGCPTDADPDQGASSESEATEEPGTADTGTSAADTSTSAADTGTSAADTGTSAADTSTSAADTSTTADPIDATMVVYVNFDGVELTMGIDDATLDQSSFAEDFDGPLEDYGGGPKRDQVMASVVEHWAPFDVALTTTRPASGDYTMVVVTPTNPFGDGVGGITSPDCFNANHRSVGFVFSHASDGDPVSRVAARISQLIGLTLGLSPTDGGGLMDASLSDGYEFVDECVPFYNTPFCPAQHTPFCPDDEQNAYAEIEAWFPLP